MHDTPSQWNVERTAGGLRVCYGDHERSEGCRWVDMVPAGEVTDLKGKLAELTMACAKLRNAVYETLPPNYPNFGSFGRGSAAEDAAIKEWERAHSAGPTHLRVLRSTAGDLSRMLEQLPEVVNILGAAMRRTGGSDG